MYAVFAGNDYYPIGGWSDYRGAYEDAQAAVDIAEALVKGREEWAEVVDLIALTVVHVLHKSDYDPN